MNKTPLQSAKERAPSVSPCTSPYIDAIIEMLDDFELETGHDLRRKEMILANLEHVREANCDLIDSANFWFREFKKVAESE